MRTKAYTVWPFMGTLQGGCSSVGLAVPVYWVQYTAVYTVFRIYVHTFIRVQPAPLVRAWRTAVEAGRPFEALHAVQPVPDTDDPMLPLPLPPGGPTCSIACTRHRQLYAPSPPTPTLELQKSHLRPLPLDPSKPLSQGAFIFTFILWVPHVF